MRQIDHVRVPLFIFRDEYGYFSAFCPSLNIAGQGRDEESAMKSFHQMVKIFLEETTRKGTLDAVLHDLGWTRKNQKEFLPPQSDIPVYLFSQQEVSLPLPVV